MISRSLESADFNRGFLDCLARLSPTDVSAERAQEVLKQIQSNPLHQVRVAAVGDEVASTTTLYIQPKFTHGGRPAGHIEDVATHLNHRGHEYGTDLVLEAVLAAEKQGCYKVVLDCSDKNVKLYQDMGFRRAGNLMRIDFP